MKRIFSVLAPVAIAATFVFATAAATASTKTSPTQSTSERELQTQLTAQLKKMIAYPKEAIVFQEEGRFDLLVYINAQGTITAVNFDIPQGSGNPLAMRHLIEAATEKVSTFTFPAEYHDGAVRIPFNFKLLK